MTTDNQVAKVDIDTLMSEANVLDAKTFLKKYRDYIRNDSYISNYYLNLSPDTLDSAYEAVKKRLASLKMENPQTSFSLPIVTKTAKPSFQKVIDPNIRQGQARRAKNSKTERLNYVVEFFDSDGKVVDTIGARDSGESVHRANAKLAIVANYASAVYYSTDILDSNGKPIKTNLTKVDAVAKVFKKKGGPAMKTMSPSNSKLEWGGKAKNDHFHFSKG